MTRREMLFALMASALAAGCAHRARKAVMKPVPPSELILCGADEVFILPVGKDATPIPLKNWSWRAAGCLNIPQSLRPAFDTTDDCKPVAGGRQVLISSSSGAVALIERETGRALFHAKVPDAHSIELLPGGRVAAVATGADSPGSNRIVIFDLASRRELASDRLFSAHGLVWDAQRAMLWALGDDVLRAYGIGDGQSRSPVLKLKFEIKLPDTGAHDLSPVPASPRLFISTGRHCWYFERDTRQFAPHEALAETNNVKSYSVHPVTGRIAYVRAEGMNWWAERVHFLNPEGVLHLPGQRLYKARWL